jgi:hypothetical protein
MLLSPVKLDVQESYKMVNSHESLMTFTSVIANSVRNATTFSQSQLVLEDYRN